MGVLGEIAANLLAALLPGPRAEASGGPLIGPAFLGEDWDSGVVDVSVDPPVFRRSGERPTPLVGPVEHVTGTDDAGLPPDHVVLHLAGGVRVAVPPLDADRLRGLC